MSSKNFFYRAKPINVVPLPRRSIVCSIDLQPESQGQVFATASRDGYLRIFDIRSG